MVGLDGDRNFFDNWSAWVPRCLCRRYGRDFSSGYRDGNSRKEYIRLCGGTPDRLPAAPGDVLHTWHALAVLATNGWDLRTRNLRVLSHGAGALASPVEPTGSVFSRPHPPHLPVAPRPIRLVVPQETSGCAGGLCIIDAQIARGTSNAK